MISLDFEDNDEDGDDDLEDVLEEGDVDEDIGAFDELAAQLASVQIYK